MPHPGRSRIPAHSLAYVPLVRIEYVDVADLYMQEPRSLARALTSRNSCLAIFFCRRACANARYVSIAMTVVVRTKWNNNRLTYGV